MDHRRDSTSTGPRRRLPSPNLTPQGNESTASETPVAPMNFYSSDKPPPLPSRRTTTPTGIGSGHTRYHAPPSPTYRAGEGTPFREPELVADEPISDEDAIPELISQDGISQPQSAWYSGRTHWDPASLKFHDSSNSWGMDVGEPGWVNWTSNLVSKKVPIDDTNEDEEMNWWDAAVREKHKRPGPGVLPLLLEDLLHHPDHSLFYVKVDPPDFTRSEVALGTSVDSSTATTANTSRSSSQSPTSGQRQPSTSPPPSPPSAEDLIHAVPHPNAYYCRKHNGWVILQWKQSTVLPPTAKYFQEDPQYPLPDQNRRKKTQSCIGSDPTFAQGNKTHHFHLYEKAVSAHKL